jgi:hypothetical protein
MGLIVMREVLLEQGSSLRVRQVRLRDRLTARMRVGALDRQLADGTAPEASVALALHATRVYQASQRQFLARTLTHLARSSRSSSSSTRLRVPVDHEAVRRALDELEAVAHRLNGDGPLNVQGLARIRLLLADGTGPLYRAARPEQLRLELRSALATLDLAR